MTIGQLNGLKAVAGAVAAIFITLGTGAMSGAKAQSEVMPIDFAGPAQFSSLALSPNGRYLAFFSHLDDRDQGGFVGVLDLQDPSSPVSLPLEGDIFANSITWVSDDHFIFNAAAKVRGRFFGGSISTFRSRVVLIDRQGKNPKYLFDNPERGATPQLLRMMPEDPDTILMAAISDSDESETAGVSLFEVNVKTGRTKRVRRGERGAIAYFVDEEGAPVFKRLLNTRQTFLRTFASQDRGKSWVQVDEQVLSGTGNEPIQFQPVSPLGGNRYLVIMQPEGEDRMALYEYDLATLKPGKMVFGHPKVDVTGSISNPFTSQYRGAVFAVDQFEMALADPEEQATLDTLKGFFGDTVSVMLVNSSADNNTWLILVSGPETPGDYYLFRRDTSGLEKLFSQRPKLEGRTSPMEIMRVKMSDGVEITSYVTHPRAGPDKPAPLLVIPHGGPQARDFYAWDFFAPFFADRGYRVIQTNFRGSAGYGETFVEAGHRQYGKRMQADVMESAEALIGRGLARKKNMCVYGWSYGGYVANTASFMNTDLFSAAISTAGLSDVVEDLNYDRINSGPNSGAYRYWVKAKGDPVKNRDELDAVSAAPNADKVGMPVLLFHGEDDTNVAVNQSQMFERALKRAGKPVEYHEFKETRHGIVTFRDDDIDFMFNRIDEFCREHLPANAWDQ